MTTPETQVAVLTPAGRGAVATVAVRGPRAIPLVQPHFAAASQRPLSAAPAGRFQFGRFRSITGSEEEIIAVAVSPSEVELHCHGGPAAANAIVQTLVAAGAMPIPWQRWVAELADPNSAECRVALAAAATERTCAILLDQYRGALTAELASIDALLTRGPAEDKQQASKRLQRLLQLAYTVGCHLTQPWRVVIAGQPNVGKSSLINALLGYERSIVLDQPGTTRDVLSALTAIDGWPVELVDTAGMRTTADPLEAAGIERAEEQLAAAHAVVLVTDMTNWDYPITGQEAIVVGNKADLLDADRRRTWQQAHPHGLVVSARVGAGIDELCRRISGRLVPIAPAAGEAVPFTQRQIAQVRERVATLGAGG